MAFGLLKGFYLYLTQREEYNVLVLGLDNAGKTVRICKAFLKCKKTLLERIKTLYTSREGLSPDKIVPTIGLNIGRIEVGAVRLQLQDLGGQTDLQSIWKSYYADCHAIIFMVDSTDSPRLDEVRRIFDVMISNVHLEGVPVLILANKQDFANALRVEQIKEIFNHIAEKLSARESQVLPVVALTGKGVQEAITWLLSRLERNKLLRPPQFK